MKYESLAGKAPFLPNVGVAVNRKMAVWDKHGQASGTYHRIVSCWNGIEFCSPEGDCFDHACEIPHKRMRPMTPKECALLPHGTVFKYEFCEGVPTFLSPYQVGLQYHYTGYCPPEDLTDDIVSSPWKPLEKECE